jgi:hypothetical protein
MPRHLVLTIVAISGVEALSKACERCMREKTASEIL